MLHSNGETEIVNAPKIPRQSRRDHHQDLLAARVAELEGRLAAQSEEVRQLKQGASEKARAALFQPDGTLSFVYYCAASGRRGAVLQISCSVKGLPLLKTALIVDGKDFDAVYARIIQLLVAAFGVGDDEALIRDMLATRDAFLRVKGLRLVEVKYHQVHPIDKA